MTDEAPNEYTDKHPLFKKKTLKNVKHMKLEIESEEINHAQESLFNKKIILNHGITKTNYICGLIHFITMLFSFLITDTLQPMILLHPKYFHIDKQNSGELMAKILAILLIYKIIVSPLYGYCIDRFGRVIMVRIAATFMLIAYLSVPYQKTVFPGFIFSKILFSNGGSIYALLPFNGDYVHDSTKGKAAGLQLTLGTLGGLLGAIFVKVLLWMNLTLGQCYVFSGFCVFSITMAYSFGLKGGREYYKKPRSPSRFDYNHNESDFKAKFKKAWEEIKKSPWILIALVLTMVGNADFYILTIIFALFVKSFFGISDVDSDISNSLISYWQLIAFSLAAIFNLVAGYYIDKVNTIKLIFPALLVTIISFLFSVLVKNPYDIYFKIIVIFPAISLPVIYTAANYLATKYTPSDIRGTINSLLGTIGYLGYVFIALFGGILFDEVHRSGPYLLYSLMLTVSAILIFKIYFSRIYGKDLQALPYPRVQQHILISVILTFIIFVFELCLVLIIKLNRYGPYLLRILNHLIYYIILSFVQILQDQITYLAYRTIMYLRHVNPKFNNNVRLFELEHSINEFF